MEHETAAWNVSVWHPRADVYEIEDALLIQVEAPGLKVEDLHLNFEPGELLVEGRRERPSLAGPARASLVEMNYGPFRRRFSLPADIDGEDIHASYEAGILQIVLRRRRRETAPNIRVEID
jgi:HSP20 family protein